MSENRQNVKPVLGKVIIKGMLHCETGLHIGASKENLEIGAIDSPVIRDPITREPYIPGSSLKGKMRSLLEKIITEVEVQKEKYPIFPNRPGGSGTNRHECNDWEPDDTKTFPGSRYCPICRLFGSTKGKKDGKNWPARLIVRDAFLTKDSRQKLEEIDTGLLYTEWKWENSLDRVTAAANPRQLERVPRGTEFKFEMAYTVESKDDLEEDLKNIKTALELLEMDYLGGHGSRGYGQVEICNLRCQVVRIKDGKLNQFKPMEFKIEEIKKKFQEGEN